MKLLEISAWDALRNHLIFEGSRRRVAGDNEFNLELVKSDGDREDRGA